MISTPLLLNRLCFLLAFFTLYSSYLQAQLTLTAPHARQVFQRDLTNRANVPVAGLAPTGTVFVQARLIPLVAGQGTPTAWASLSLLTGSQLFSGVVSTTGGWYQLQVRARDNALVMLAQTTLNRVGVGEVFIIAGQSNALGVFEESATAADDRVSGIDSRQDDVQEQMLPVLFSHVSAGSNFAPSNPPYCWAALGDMLTARLNVPVLFLGAAQGGTNSNKWQQSAAGITGNGVSAGLSPYRRLGAALSHYAARTGVRAVLRHQGESDNLDSTATQTYFDNINYVIQTSRRQIGFGNLAWVMSRASYIRGTTRQAVINAQNNLISQVPGVWPGPLTDTFINASLRPDGLHFGGSAGLTTFANLWNQCLTDSLFQTTPAFLPATPALLTVGYTLPSPRRPGEVVLIPFVTDAPVQTGNLFRGQLVRTTDGTLIAESAPTTQNPLPLTLPVSLTTGNYRFRVVSGQPAISSPLGETFAVSSSAPVYTNPVTAAPPSFSGTTDAAVVRIGYKYDGPSHGFNTLVSSTTAVEVRLERIDGQSFADNTWRTATATTEFPDFNYTRLYLPQSLGVGGVEPEGRYRLSVRRAGTAGSGQWIELTFIDKRHTLYIGLDPAPTPPVVSDLYPCLDGVFVSVKAGSWADPSVWLCGTVPTARVVVNLRHILSIPAGYVARCGILRYDAGGRLELGSAARLNLGQ